MSDTASEPAGRVFKGRLARRHIRNKLAAALQQEKGLTRREAWAKVDSISDDQIDEAAAKQGQKVGAIGDGAVINWIIANGPAIFEIIKTLLTLFAVLGPAPAAAKRKGRKC